MRATRGFCLIASFFASFCETLADSTLFHLHVDTINALSTRPYFSWNTTSPGRQTAYRIQVSGSRAGLVDVWDSGVVFSSESLVEYRGPTLSSGRNYLWTVNVETADGHTAVASSEFLAPFSPFFDWHSELGKRQAAGDLGALATQFKAGTWIWTADEAATPIVQTFNAPAGDRFFRTTYIPPVGKTAVMAEILITADNSFSLFVDGAPVGQSPANNPDSWETAQGYQMLLSPGPTVFAVQATNSPSALPTLINPAGLLVAIRVTHSDATQVVIGTDKTWKSNVNAVAGFQLPTTDDSTWPAATEIAKFGTGPWLSSVTIPTSLALITLPTTSASALPSSTSALPSTSSTLPNSTSSLPSSTQSSTTSFSTESTSFVTSTITSTSTSPFGDASSAVPSEGASSKSDNKSTLIGAILGGVLGLFLVLTLILIFWRRRKHARDAAADSDTWLPAPHPAPEPNYMVQKKLPSPISGYDSGSYGGTSYGQSQAPYRYPPPSHSMSSTHAPMGDYYPPQQPQYSGNNMSHGGNWGSTSQLIPPGESIPRNLTPGGGQRYYPSENNGNYDQRYY